MTTTDELEALAAQYVEHIERSVPAVLVVVRSADELRRAPIVVTARITRGDRDLPGQAFAGAVVGATCVLKRALQAQLPPLPHAPTQSGS
jgi:hypothetical protein